MIGLLNALKANLENMKKIIPIDEFIVLLNEQLRLHASYNSGMQNFISQQGGMSYKWPDAVLTQFIYIESAQAVHAKYEMESKFLKRNLKGSLGIN